MKRIWVMLAIAAAMAGGAARAQGDDACSRAMRAQTGGADYQPGVDVHGKAVAPADVAGTIRIEPPKVIEFPVTLDVARRAGFAPRGPYEANLEVAKVRIEGSRVFINGQAVNPDDSTELIAACRAARK
ncbi:conserved exported hypothetical protein [uncultured Alphaproteobacteria bacterium]|uniref:Uncharacterized protein n=1 Tax=uncultured Alphaproteobacteria bacterium TaxID=91750 RepID=A0A212J8I5_9PROT|nr:conserved exported hypothetical protein [uncultured Alphaproteobacteria bacterium]